MNILHEDFHAAAEEASQHEPTALSPQPPSTRRLPVWAAVAVATVVFAFVYPPFGVGPLAFLAVAPIALVFLDPRVRCSLPTAAAAGFVFGQLASMAIVGPWMYSAASIYFAKSAAFALAFTAFINATNVALFYVPAFVLIRMLAGAPASVRIVGAAAVWTALEYVRAAVLLGNPWALLGQGLYDVPLLREAAAVGGVWGLTFACAATGAAFGVALQRGISPHEQRRAVAAGVAAALALPLCGLGARVLTPQRERVGLVPLRVAVVQAEIDSRDLWKPELRLAHLESYMALTRTLTPGSVDLVVWPENAVPFLLDADSRTRQALADLARRLRAALLLGAPRSETSSANGRATARFFNSAFLFPADGGMPSVYDKVRLLPYVEADPSLPVPGRAIDTEHDWHTGAGYAAGTDVVLFDVGGWRIAPLICLEAVHAQYARAAVAAGADVLVNLSNDAWFSGGAGPEQHFAMSSLRAAENRRPLVRAANGGISGAVDAAGEPVGPAIRRARAVVTYTLQVPPGGATIYQRCGDWFAALSFVIAALCLLRARRGANVAADLLR